MTPHRPLARQLQDEPETAPWDPSPALGDRAEQGLDRFLRGAGQNGHAAGGDDQGEEPQR
ncbi:hypothetical protein [Streptomyces antarcticus]|uniref:hypothetical protein n=1 Tax=Streptomyces antarcticus TaxID=2996458 RepID=UPI00226E0F25|nr:MULTISPECIES: hypothetical protein [unclassified Streptomyces]MCY0947506.1 hypothetical protein [Streptomyces sp. H34-AA3]MCZ4088405.1 hypothetical protein [Streptomyces sp. H34-S5]